MLSLAILVSAGLVLRVNRQTESQGKKIPGRPRAMLLDATMQEDEESEIDHAKLKEQEGWLSPTERASAG